MNGSTSWVMQRSQLQSWTEKMSVTRHGHTFTTFDDVEKDIFTPLYLFIYMNSKYTIECRKNT